MFTSRSGGFSNFNQTSRSKSQTLRDFRSSQSQEKLIPIQRREKLKSLLIVKFMKKYGIKDSETILEEEISKFLRGEKLTDQDLKILDQKIHNIIQDNKNQEILKRNLTTSCHEDSIHKTESRDQDDVRLPEIKDNISVCSKQSKTSKMSGVSKLSHFSETQRINHNPNKKRLDYDSDDDDDCVSRKNDNGFVNPEGDNWNAIAKHNQKLFEEEKIQNKIKDREIKRRIKDDLDLQVREKLLRSNEELKKNREFDVVVLQHVDSMNKAEKLKELEIKNRVLKEKENRDKQLVDDSLRKRQELKKNKKIEKEIGKVLLFNIL